MPDRAGVRGHAPAPSSFTLLLTAATAPAQSISGTVFEDFNYGGGAGRDLAAPPGSVAPPPASSCTTGSVRS